MSPNSDISGRPEISNHRNSVEIHQIFATDPHESISGLNNDGFDSRTGERQTGKLAKAGWNTNRLK
jgi:hypothetical protein